MAHGVDPSFTDLPLREFADAMIEQFGRDAAAGAEFATGFGRPVTLRVEDNQGLEAQLVGTTKAVAGYDFKLLDNMMIFDPKVMTNPPGIRSVEWLKTLKPDFVKIDVPTFKQ